jgi:hypothetical protein
MTRDCHRSRRLDVRSQVLTKVPNSHSCALHNNSVYTKITHLSIRDAVSWPRSAVAGLLNPQLRICLLERRHNKSPRPW